jgi:hypothetical protein
MDIDPKARRRAEVIDEVSKWTVGAGILVVALAPLAIPILALTAVALLPLALPLIPIALIAGLVYLPVRVVRGLRRRRALRRGGAAEEEVLPRVELETFHAHLVK